MMKQRRRIILLFVACLIFTGAIHAQVTMSSPPKTYAVVVGISQYQNTAIPRLMYADKDASLFAAWLQSKAGGSVPGYQVKLLTNENASLANIYDALPWLESQVQPGDKVYLYFSGHGDIETRDSISQGYLLAWDSPATNYRNNAVSVADLNDNARILTTTNKAKVIIITDACHSGKLAGDFYKGRALTATNLRLVLNNQVRLAACEAGEEAAEGPAWGDGRGVFSYHLLRGLQGMAFADSSLSINLGRLQEFLQIAFKTDAILEAEKHRQHPVVDGSPVFIMSVVDSTNLHNLTTSGNSNAVVESNNPAGLQSLKTLGKQPIDFFFTIAKTVELDTSLHFENYVTTAPAQLPKQMVADYIHSLRTGRERCDSLAREDRTLMEISNSIFTNIGSDSVSQQRARDKLDSIQLRRQIISFITDQILAKKGYADTAILEILLRQLQTNKYLIARFNEKFVELTHAKMQAMINAYLEGDLAELEKRQYYFYGSRQYRGFLPALEIAENIADETSYLRRILEINRLYLSGLVDRLDMATAKKTDSLLQSALAKQQMALQLEPYAAYIYNELGNLYMHRKNYDSAAYHFDYALLLSPAWAVPWSNKIRLNLALGNLPGAKQAIQAAESLQPNLGYVNVNAGLVMEKDSNWLAAESYYLNAIAQNNVHYLPYERLGFVYIQLGKYALANSFLLEAKKRKDQFAVNADNFTFGIELGGSPENWPDDGKVLPTCELVEDVKLKGRTPVIVLANTLRTLSDSLAGTARAEKLLQEYKKPLAPPPLLHHYLGLRYFQQKKWTLAEGHIKEAMRLYKPASSLDSMFKKMLSEGLSQEAIAWQQVSANETDSGTTSAANIERIENECLFNVLRFFTYNQLEDHYLLAALFEKQEKYDKALDLYSIIADKENEWLMEQAVFAGYKPIIVTSDETQDLWEKAEMRYEKPVKMSGTLKAARLQEKLGNFTAAEAILLKQINLNRKAGYARQAEMDKQNFGPAGYSPFNFFWLRANFDLEAETHNFYARVLKLFPRDGEWYRKAGLFLYDRLKLTYSRIATKEQNAFYEFSKRHAYPYKGGESGPTEETDLNGRYFIEVNKIKIPATGEEIDISMKAYDPLAVSLSYLQLAERFSGELIADTFIVAAITDLEKWMGNIPAAINGYQALLTVQPGNDRVRNEFVELLEANNRLVEASAELEILDQHKALTSEQLLKLAYYKIVSNDSRGRQYLVNQSVPPTSAYQTLMPALQMHSKLLSGKFKEALAYYKDSIEQSWNNKEQEVVDSMPVFFPFDNLAYTYARLLALSGKKKAAMQQIKNLVDASFNYEQVLLNDAALAGLRKTKSWRRLMQRYDFSEAGEDEAAPKTLTNYNTLHYRIPGSSYNPR